MDRRRVIGDVMEEARQQEQSQRQGILGAAQLGITMARNLPQIEERSANMLSEILEPLLVGPERYFRLVVEPAHGQAFLVDKFRRVPENTSATRYLTAMLMEGIDDANVMLFHFEWQEDESLDDDYWDVVMWVTDQGSLRPLTAEQARARLDTDGGDDTRIPGDAWIIPSAPYES